MREKILMLRMEAEKKFEEQFGFQWYDMTWPKVVEYMHRPKDPSSLAATRILFGLAMLFDIPDERGGANMERRWGDPATCHFPLLPFIHALRMPYMVLVYAALWLGAVGIMLGYKYKVSSAMFAVSYWYLFLIEKSYWNNHSYLFGLVSVLLACTEANCYWSIDAYLDPAKKKESVPYWNYFVLKYQFFILYFMAGVKKGTAEWLTGYSVQNLSEHWVFAPFRMFLTVPQVDYLVVHWFIFAFDLTVAGWMMWGRTRHVAMTFCALFHLMNSRIFRIGMFPWVCLATMPLFYPFDWPKLFVRFIRKQIRLIRNKINYSEAKGEENMLNNSSDDNSTKSNSDDFNNDFDEHEESRLDEAESEKEENENHIETQAENKNVEETSFCNNECKTNGNSDDEKKTDKVDSAKNYTVVMILLYVFMQAFLPFSHFITEGYNNWTDGLYGYSWDMMVHTWDPHTVVVKITDNEKKTDYYIDPWLFTPNDRWSRHGDMIYQYARCLKNKVEQSTKMAKNQKMSRNISIYVDVWCSMNGRFAQRMFDPNVDLLTAKWTPFQPIPFLMPILDDALSWRTILEDIRKDVSSWSKYNDVTFFAEYPGYGQEKYIPKELRNVTLSILEGQVSIEPEVTQNNTGQSTRLTKGDHVRIPSRTFHKVRNIGKSPAFYMYTFYNATVATIGDVIQKPKPKLPLGSELARRFINMIKFGNIVVKGLFQIFSMSECPLR